MLDLLNLLADGFASILTSDCLDNWTQWFSLPVCVLIPKIEAGFGLESAQEITDLFQKSFMSFFDNLPQFVYDLDV